MTTGILQDASGGILHSGGKGVSGQIYKYRLYKHTLYMWSSKQSSDSDSAIALLHYISNAESESQDFQIVTNLTSMKLING